MKAILEDEKCTGCGACINICPTGAISFYENDEGFNYPKLNEDKCINCRLCKEVCQCLKQEYKNSKNPDCFAYKAEDNIREKSTSGGAFYIIATNFIKDDGYVSGAIWNKKPTVSHIVSDKTDDIEKMRGSKYLQSNINTVYKEIKNILDDNKKVLFSGTPCQVAGLKKFLRKDYANLYCIDIICHGVPSPKVFKKYINEEILIDENDNWLNTNFRDKESNSEHNCITTISSKNRNSIILKNDLYMNAFLKDLCLRKSCKNCMFSTFPRQGDITIGDFWKIGKYKKEYVDKKGISVILINNKKGKKLSEILKKNSVLYKKVPLKYAINGNPNLIKSSNFHKYRDDFLKNLNNDTLENLLKLYLYNGSMIMDEKYKNNCESGIITNPKVSIITPCYNGESHLKNFLDSLLIQDYSEVEFFFVDDGSTDNTKSIFQEYIPKLEAKGWEVKYIYKNNGGAASAINAALPLITGKYFIWPDSDDILYPNHISIKVQFMEENPEYAIAYAPLDIVKEENLDKITGIYDFIPNNKMFKTILKEKNILWTPVGTIVKTEALFDVIPDKRIYEGQGGQNCQIQMPILYKYTCGHIDEHVAKRVLRQNSHFMTTRKKFLSRRMMLLKIWIATILKLKYAGKSEKIYYITFVLFENIRKILKHYLKKILFFKKAKTHNIFTIFGIKIKFKRKS